MADITIPEGTLRDVVAAQLAVRFSDPEIIQGFVYSILETRVDSMGRVSGRQGDPTMCRWAIEKVVRTFVEDTAKAWLAERHDRLAELIGEELEKSELIQRIAQETAAKVTVR